MYRFRRRAGRGFGEGFRAEEVVVANNQDALRIGHQIGRRETNPGRLRTQYVSHRISASRMRFRKSGQLSSGSIRLMKSSSSCRFPYEGTVAEQSAYDHE